VRQIWLPLGAVLLAYWLAAAVNEPLRGRFRQGAPNHLGLPLHVVEPVRVDEFVFGGLPTSWLQQRLYDPSGPRWYDAVVAVVYVSHFVVIPAVAVVLWRWARPRFRAWIGGVGLMVGIGTTVYIAYPMAPPWIAAELGLAGPAHRISGAGWDYLGLSPVADLLGAGQASANPVAAMPSMHAAAPALVAAFFWAGASWWGRLALVLYPLAMGFALVYTAEHYVVDVVAGGLIAAAVVIAWTAGRRWSARRAAGSAQGTGTGSTCDEGSPARRRP
jgi:membrane-associated phospholipid phosphatase